jgi:2-oxoglutarate ferredoxin oxidoreductase subunit beta
VNILLFNNEIYGLTKGQYSPTSRIGQVTKSSPMGVVDYPFDTASLALGAGATFVARTVDVEQKHLQGVLHAAVNHRGTSFVEILQNCPIFNDGAFDDFTDDKSRAYRQLLLEDGKPMVFGPEDDRRGIRLGNGLRPEVVSLKDADESQMLVHDVANDANAFFLASFDWQNPAAVQQMPVPLGVLRAVDRPTYESGVHGQIAEARKKPGAGDFDRLFASGDSWVVD